jgi:peptidoglycan/xylan/chitin deacetylase (PgdA/CDA1 family)
LCGQRVEAHPELARAIVASGHQAYAHGYSHVRIDVLSEAEALDEIVRTEELISRFRTSPSPYLVRLPFGSGHGEARIHRLLRRWRSDCQIAHWSYNPEDFKIAEGCSTRSELEEKCGLAAGRIFNDPKINGKAILMHDDPIGATGTLAHEIARIFLSKILTTAAERQFAIAGFEPASNNAWVRRYVRPWIKY